ncbi:hypothetical protein Efla_006517 [Eimeria flavescens]
MAAPGERLERPVRTLLIDNYDSFTYNLYQLIAVVSGTPPAVVFNDSFDGDWEEVCAAFPDVDNIVISPGPGTPQNPADFGLSAAAIANSSKPLLGVCLGHQGLGYLSGAKIVQAPEIVHGRCTRVEFSSGCRLFAGLPRFADVARYHSLCIDPQSLPVSLSVTAWTDTPAFTIMGIQDRDRPFFGIQFHPESVGTPCGEQILRNFVAFTRDWQKARSNSLPPPVSHRPLDSNTQVTSTSQQAPKTHPGIQQFLWEVNIAELPGDATQASQAADAAEAQPAVSSCQLFERLFGNSPACFWLDSSSSDPSLAATGPVERDPVSRFSFMGDALGPWGFALESWRDDRTRQVFRCPQGCRSSDRLKLHSRELPVDPFEALRLDGLMKGGLTALRLRFWRATAAAGKADSGLSQLELVEDQADAEPPPFTFWGGFVGFFAYELRRRAFARLRRALGSSLPQEVPTDATKLKSAPHQPLSLWLFVDRFVAVDNHTGRYYVVWLTPVVQPSDLGAGELSRTRRPNSQRSACEPLVSMLRAGAVTAELRRLVAEAQEQWALTTLRTLAACPAGSARQAAHMSAASEASAAASTASHSPPATGNAGESALAFCPSLSEEAYKASIRRILEEITKGNAYEVCLTDQTVAAYDPRAVSPFKLYSRLRDRNRSKYGVYLRYDWSGRLSRADGSVVEGEEASSSTALAVCCASPELFLNVDLDGWVESRPIKGTRRRGSTPEEDAALKADLAASEKDKAENMMVVDLVRNDLGRVCVEGSVSVPRFLTVESHPAVHHMVSVVRGKLREPQYDAIDAVVAAFPGGSMTGAPKLSAMNIIDKCEAGPRGLYSGSLGFFSVNGAACLNIVIRTAVFDSSHQVSVGSGGAIISLSSVDEEYEEMQLKAASVVRNLNS